MSKPEKVFKMGAVRASVFCNMIERNGQAVPLRKVVLEVRYKDKHGEWQGTSSLSINDLPKAVTALQQAYEYLLSEQPKNTEDTFQEMPEMPAAPRSPPSLPARSPPSGYPRVTDPKRF